MKIEICVEYILLLCLIFIGVNLKSIKHIKNFKFTVFRCHLKLFKFILNKIFYKLSPNPLTYKTVNTKSMFFLK
jgi:hypothetical protein